MKRRQVIVHVKDYDTPIRIFVKKEEADKIADQVYSLFSGELEDNIFEIATPEDVLLVRAEKVDFIQIKEVDEE